MEWVTTQHLDLQPTQSAAHGTQPQCGAFHHSQALFAAAVGHHIVEIDALTGCKLSSIDIGGVVARMAYSPAGGHLIVAVLEDWTIRSWDLDTEHSHVLYSPEKKTDKVAGSGLEVHMALTPLRPWLFFAAHRHMSVNVVGTVEGARPAMKMKTDLKKPVTELACHPRSPLLYVAYADGLIRAYHIQTFTVQYTLLIDNSIKLIGAGAFAFHSTLEWVFVGDRSGTLMAWDVSVPTQPGLIGITQVGSTPIAAIAWHPMLRFLMTLSKDGSVQVWRARLMMNPNRPPMRANFFESAGVEAMDVANILTQSGGEVIYPLPRIVDLLVHPKFNLATVLFASAAGGDDTTSKASVVSREARKHLFSVLQSARGSPGSVLKEKLAVLGSTGILPDHQFQLQQARGQFSHTHLTMSDFARKAFLYGKSGDGKRRQSILLSLPLLTVADHNHHLRDIPVCQPFQQELKFFNTELGIFNYPQRIFFMDGCNLTAYNLSSGDYNIYKKFSPTALGGNERYPKHMLYSTKQHSFLIFFECRGATSEVVLYREPLATEMVGERVNTITGRDGAFVGYNESQYAILDEDGLGLTLYFLEDMSILSASRPSQGEETNGALDPSSFSEQNLRTHEAEQRGSIQFIFDSPVQRIYSSPLESCFLYVCAGSHIGLARVFASAHGSGGDPSDIISTRPSDGRLLKLNPLETVLQVRWQELSSAKVAAVMTTQRVLIISTHLEILSSSSMVFDKCFPPFRSIVWVGPSLFFSTATTIAILGWDGVARSIVTIATPNSAIIGVLNDRILLAAANDPNPRQKQGVEVKTRLLGLLEPLLIGWTTMQFLLEPKLDLSEILYKLTSRFDSHRITPQSLDVLTSGPPVCGGLAVELAQAGPQFTQVLRCKYAINARRFTTALSILKDEYLRSRDYPRCPPTSRLFQRFQELGRACIRYGQFDHAKESFDAVSDFQSMIDLFICHLNPSALRRLTQKLEEAGADPELRRQCEKILSVRSSGWGQGGVFSNLAAESMAPKGPEWGGGNWEIKVHPEMKSFPEWELSGEVTAYMKTPNGAIPTIIPDHIGVYLGTLKGRGSVVEVREDAIIPKLANSDIGADNLALVLAGAGSGASKALEAAIPQGGKAKMGILLAADSKMDSVLTSDDISTDEQSKAAEEFKKGMYKLDDSSSDDDEAVKTKTKKLQIRIREKPTTGTAVDVDKVKEATRQFKLGDALPPLGSKARRSSGGSQELPLNTFPQGFATQDMQLPRSSVDGPLPMMMGMGVVAGPIPEDFFQGNGSGFGTGFSVQSSVAPTGAQPFQAGMWTSTMVAPSHTLVSHTPGHAVPQAMQGNLGFSAGGPLVPLNAASFELAPSGVPPQSLAPLNATSFEPIPSGVSPQTISQTLNLNIGLPDGGVPPQANSKQSLETASLVPDLGIFENSSGLTHSSASGDSISKVKSAAYPPSPPRMMRPGQVPRGAPASKCFNTALVHLEQNQLSDALSCLDESFLALAKDRSLGLDIKVQARICAQYKVAVLLLQEITRLQKIEGPGGVSAKEEMARLARHLSSLPLLAKHRPTCIRTAIKRNMDVQNYAFSKSLLDLLLSKAPANKQEELKALINLCVQRGLSDRTIDDSEDASEFCAATLTRLPTIGHDTCDLCGSKFSALNSPGCTICGMGTIKRSDAVQGSFASPFS